MDKEARTDDLYLTREQVNSVLEALNLSMERHYREYDDDLPEELIEIINQFVEARSKFRYCPTCVGRYYYQRWSGSTCSCPQEEE
jgi:hypothetical protein